MGERDAQRRAAWRFVRAVIRSQRSGVIGAAVAGLLWQAGAVAAPLMVKNAIDHGVIAQRQRTRSSSGSAPCSPSGCSR